MVLNIRNFLSLILLMSTLLTGCISFFSWRKGKIYAAIALVPVSIYTFGYAFEISSISLEKIRFWLKIEYLGIPFLSIVWLIFALNFTGYEEKVKKSIFIFLNVIPIVTIFINYTNDFHHLFYKKFYLDESGAFPVAGIIQGPWYWVNIAYTYGLMLVGMVIFIIAYVNSISVIKKQIFLLIAAWIIPWIADVIYIFKLLPINVDLCPLAFSISSIVSSFVIFRFKLLKLTPIALEKVFDNMSEGVIIMDSGNNIVNFNNSAKNIISELKFAESKDGKIDGVLKKYDNLLKVINCNCVNERNLISIKENEELKYYRININNIIGNSSEIIGKILTLNDVTEIELQKKKTLEDRERISKLLKFKEAMLNIGYCINEISNINDLLQLILDEVVNCIDDNSSGGSVLLLDEDNNLKVAASKRYDLEKVKLFKIGLEEQLRRFNRGEDINKTIIFDDIDEIRSINMLDTIDGKKIKSVISSPIAVEGKLYGFLNIDSIYSNFFNEGDLELMDYMRSQVSIAITKHKLYEETIYLSRYDKLTSIYNRNYFEQLFNNIVYEYSTNKKEFLAVVFDLNGLKFVNDNYGHLAGDELIRVFSKGLTSIKGENDVLGRFGGDEFVGIFFNVDVISLTNRFEKLINQFVSNPIRRGNEKIICSYSYGIVSFPQDGILVDELLKVADKRMYKYKSEVKK